MWVYGNQARAILFPGVIYLSGHIQLYLCYLFQIKYHQWFLYQISVPISLQISVADPARSSLLYVLSSCMPVPLQISYKIHLRSFLSVLSKIQLRTSSTFIPRWCWIPSGTSSPPVFFAYQIRDQSSHFFNINFHHQKENSIKL